MAKRGNSEGSIYHQKTRGRYVAAYVDATGKRQYLYAQTRSAVADKLHDALQARKNGLPVADQRLQLADYLNDWLANTVKPARRPGTYIRYETAVRLHITPTIGKVKLA